MCIVSKYLLITYILKSVYIEKKSKSHKILKKVEGFSYFFPFLMEVEGSGSVQILRYPDPGGPKEYGSGSTTLLPALTHSTRRRCESSRSPRQ